MKSVQILIPALVTIVITAIFVILAIWLTALVPPGEWNGLIKAGIVLFVFMCTLLVIAWSAYFTLVIRRSLEK
ncbi:MAG: hypothetical protein FJZ83_00470 [Chloroflexi bacterium]|nr:hypothetical protein [Chloroflexota bacterium]MBM3182488.1 hypothetical protein [Chloroflexota bacterium]